jgi:hypothetical protein
MNNEDEEALLRSIVAAGRSEPMTRLEQVKDRFGAHHVSLIELIANPEAYDGKRAQVEGYLHLGFEHQAIYLHQEDFELGMSKNALWVDLSGEIGWKQSLGLSDRYVICAGTFRARDLGHMAAFSGAIASVTRLEPIPRLPRVPAKAHPAAAGDPEEPH